MNGANPSSSFIRNDVHIGDGFFASVKIQCYYCTQLSNSLKLLIFLNFLLVNSPVYLIMPETLTCSLFSPLKPLPRPPRLPLATSFWSALVRTGACGIVYPPGGDCLWSDFRYKIFLSDIVIYLCGLLRKKGSGTRASLLSLNKNSEIRDSEKILSEQNSEICRSA